MLLQVGLTAEYRDRYVAIARVCLSPEMRIDGSPPWCSPPLSHSLSLSFLPYTFKALGLFQVLWDSCESQDSLLFPYLSAN